MKKWLVAFVVFIGLNLMGCSNSGMLGDKPPKASIKIGNKMYKTTLGSYCWDIRGRGACVDTAGPKVLLEGEKPIKIKPGEKITFVMNYKPNPNEFHVIQMTENKEIEVEVENNRFTAPTQQGIYYYSYSVWWMDKKEVNVSHGDASYAFVLEVN
ncbi:hypothetical protein [Bacillus sp. AFS031507]|uniref:hypothetical protein n=1 Tax=Bacillus sp. AFS031507 TaxID=2033496 RepID=UPI000BFE63AB|nr:hypothetical protein [Bacillus sp. AFS031507]PGY06824.1 hypothetical protein COE25_26165 [Bacillus sp. AFS031507]